MIEFNDTPHELDPCNVSLSAVTQRVHFFTHFVRSVVNSL